MDWFLNDNGLRHERVKSKKEEKKTMNPLIKISITQTSQPGPQHIGTRLTNITH